MAKKKLRAILRIGRLKLAMSAKPVDDRLDTTMYSCVRYFVYARPVLYVAVLIGLIGTHGVAASELRCARIFSDHMVLQENEPSSVWGWGSPGSTVKVEIASQTQEATASRSGEWQVKLSPITDPGPFELKVSSGSEQLVVRDILVGEVWLAAGQSNMARTMDRVPGCAAEIPTMQDPKLRFFRVTCKADAKPQADVGGSWKLCEPSNARFQSATAYYFGKTLRRELGKPVGIIFSAWGGTHIVSWTPLSMLSSDPGLLPWLKDFEDSKAKLPGLMPRYQEARKAWEASPPDKRSVNPPMPPIGDNHLLAPSNLYNTMIHPLRSFSIRGFVWYQGESDALFRRSSRYARTFRAMISSWRQAWGGDLPFYFIQLPRYVSSPSVKEGESSKALEESREWSRLRLAQAAVLDLPNTGMVVTVDSEQTTELHPDNKEIVGTRLGRLVLQDVYHLNLSAHFPMVTGALEKEGRTITLSVANAGDGLKSSSGPGSIQIVEEKGVVSPEKVVFSGSRIALTLPIGVKPLRIQYVNGPQPVADIFNSDGLPLAPFSLACP